MIQKTLLDELLEKFNEIYVKMVKMSIENSTTKS